ncbi:hypothetical protein [Chryseobacterium gallinarum]|uniref:DUF4843 domain-containing protein n=1 Tax=Chryseobacterium gallinarum TaxID=1324352 RepID=A0ABX6KS03_CHRGL|nr:hypothetical protein [Chryseobacterium gallinarum]QIY91393.1 hypothetical protein FOB44_12415 [Chryseobacterium gallinarum]
MKTLKYLFILFLSFSMSSCENEEIHYEGDPYLSFINTSSQELVDQGSGSKVVEVQYGTIAKVPNAEVRLVVDQTSQLKEGIDFEFMGPSNPSGNFDGKIAIKLLESGASPEGKNAVFRLSSPTIKNGIFNQVHTMTVALKCPISYFLNASFKATMPFFNGATYDVDITEGPEANTLLLKDYFANGTDIKLKYNPSTGAITLDTQQTGYIHPSYGMVSIRQVATTASTVNFCTRKIVLSYQPFVSAGNFAAVVDNIVGN